MKVKRFILFLILSFLLVGCSNDTLTAQKVFSDLIKDIGTVVEGDINLPNTVNGLQVAYSSSDESIITSEGVVTRGDIDATVDITIYVLVNSTQYETTFTLTVKKKETNITDEIQKAIDDLTSYLSGINKDLYSEENFLILEKIIDDAILETKNCTDIDLLQSIVDKAKTDISNVPVLEVVDEFSEYKKEVLARFEKYALEINKDLYSDENFLILEKIIDDAILETRNCTDKDLLQSIVDKAKTDISNVPMLEIYDDFSEYKKKMLADFEKYYSEINRDDYYDEDLQLIDRLYDDSLYYISQALDTTSLNLVISDFKEEISDIEKKPTLEQIKEYQELAKVEVKAYYDSLNKEFYSEENIIKLSELYQEALLDIEKQTTYDDIDETYLIWIDKLEEVEKEKTTLEKLLDIEDDLESILMLSGKVIKANITLKPSSLYNSKIIWISSNESILSTTGVVGDNISNTVVTLSYKVELNGEEYDGIAIDIYVSTDNALPSYYDLLDLSLTGSALKTALRTLITSTHKRILSYADLKKYNPLTDVDPNNSNNLILFYTRKSVKAQWDGGETWNREHVWPQSKGWFTTSGAGADIHHLRPANPSVNTSRGNKAYGEVTNSSYYCPNDEVKGDAARIIFYLLVRYKEADSYSITKVAQSMDMLLKWNILDPVDDFEMYRNEKSAEIQGNRNPFIDNPDFAMSIWSGGTNVNYEFDANETVMLVEVTLNYAIVEETSEKEYF